MTAVPSLETGVVTNKDDLVAYIASGCKPANLWRIGTEHEKFMFATETLQPPPYYGQKGVKAFLLAMHKQFGWQPVYENEQPIALIRDNAAISLEPAGQLELSGAPLENLHQTCAETQRHLYEVKTVSRQLDLNFLGLGFHPTATREAMPWMPKGRYAIMKAYMPKKGNLGLDMMLRTTTIQVNLDYASEADMVRKFRASLALQPMATLLFANSPFTEGKPNGYKSFRAQVWEDTDADRCGLLPFVFEEGMGFERYVDYMLDVPMYFVYRHGRYIDASGQSFRDFMRGTLPAYPNELPTLSDWADHLSTAFPEVRLKKFLEMRGADGGAWQRICALPAFWVGLLYDNNALEAALDLVKTWTVADIDQLRRDIAQQGFGARIQQRSVQDVALDALDIARSGLARRAQMNQQGRDETHFLDALQDIAESGKTPADSLLEKYHHSPEQGLDWLFTDNRY
jgi:glutamate--cysteine ligase